MTSDKTKAITINVTKLFLTTDRVAFKSSPTSCPRRTKYTAVPQKVYVAKLKPLAKQQQFAMKKFSLITKKLRENCHHPKSARKRYVEVIQSGILGMYESEITHEFCGHYIGDIP